MRWFDFSNGKEVSEYMKKGMIDRVIKEMKNDKTHCSSQTGNFLVVRC